MNEITLYERITDPIEAVEKFGNFLARSGMLGCEKVEQGQLLALTMLCERKSPVQLLKEYHLIQGKLVDRVDAMASKFMAAGGKYVINKRTADEASVTLTTPNQTMTFSLTWPEIKDEPWVKSKNGELKDNYKSARGKMKMLWWRCMADGIAALMPNVVTGLPEGENEDDHTTTIEAPKDLLRSAPTVTTSPAPNLSQAKVVNEDKPVETPVAVSESELKRPFPKVATLDANGAIDADTVEALQILTKGVEDHARGFAIAKGWIGANLVAGDEWWRFVPVAKINAILKQPQRYLDAIKPTPALA